MIKRMLIIVIALSISSTAFAYTVRSGHPRIYVNSTNKTAIASRITSYNQAMYKDVFDGSYGLETYYSSTPSAQDIPTQLIYACKAGLVYTLDIDDADIDGWSYSHTLAQYATKGIAMLNAWAARGSGYDDVYTEHAIVAYDHLYSLMTSGERSDVVTALKACANYCINDNASTRNPWGSKMPGLMRYTMIGLAFYGDGIDDATAISYCNDYNTYFTDRAMQAFNWMGGAWFAGMDYWVSYGNRLSFVLEAWKTATTDSVNLYTTYEDFYTGFPKFVLHNIAPNADGEWLRLGDHRIPTGQTQAKIDDATGNPSLSRGLGVLLSHIRCMAEDNSDSDTAALCSWLINEYSLHTYNDPFLMIWDNPSASQADISSLSTTDKWDNQGMVFSRSAFDGNDDQDIDTTATSVVFVSKPYYLANHDNGASNYFLINRGNPLAIRGGCYEGGDKSSHEANYHYHSIAFPSILIYDPDETWTFSGAQSSTTSNTGSRHWSADYPSDVDSLSPSIAGYYGEGIRRYYDNSTVLYVQGDASDSWGDKATLDRRDFIWVKSGNYFAVFDRVTESAANQAKDSGSNKKYWVTRFEVAPTISGSDFYANDTSGTSRIYYKTILPTNHSVSYTSGADRFDDLEGTNYPFNTTYYADVTDYGIGQIKVAPTGADIGTHNQFLHVIRVGSNSVTMPTTELLTITGDAIGVYIADSSEELFFLFASDSDGSDIDSTISYTVSPSVNSRHIVAGLSPNRNFTVAGELYGTDDSGLLEFTDDATIETTYNIVEVGFPQQSGVNFSGASFSN